jgi:hypothetical protein
MPMPPSCASLFRAVRKQAHDLIQKNASVDDLSKAYMDNLREQFGDSMEISDEFKWEWVSIPHIYHTPFYVYAYAFGQLLVFSLYQQFKAEGDSFKPKYLKIIRWRLRSAGEDPGRGGRGHPLGGVLAGRLRCIERDGGRTGEAPCHREHFDTLSVNFAKQSHNSRRSLSEGRNDRIKSGRQTGQKACPPVFV